MLSPLREEVTSDEKVKSGSDRALDLVTVDTDVEQDLAMQYGVRACLHAAHAERVALTHSTQIRSLPTVIAFKDGKPIDQFTGAVPAPALRRFIQSV